MALSRAQVCLAMLAPLLASAGCGGATPCATCDAGPADTPIKRVEDAPALDIGQPAEAGSEAIAATADGPDGRLPATRDTPAGEARQPAPILDAGYAFLDDFRTGQAQGWEQLGGRGAGGYLSDWTVIQAETGPVLSQGALDGDIWRIAYATATLTQDHLVEARLRAVDFVAEAPSYMVALFGRYDPTTDSGYLLALGADGSVLIRRRDHGVSASWGGSVAQAVRPGVWYTARLEIKGGSITAFIDGVQAYAVTDDNPLVGDHVGLGAFGATLEVASVLAVEL